MVVSGVNVARREEDVLHPRLPARPDGTGNGTEPFLDRLPFDVLIHLTTTNNVKHLKIPTQEKYSIHTEMSN